MKKDYKNIVFYRTKSGTLRWFDKNKYVTNVANRQTNKKLKNAEKHEEDRTGFIKTKQGIKRRPGKLTKDPGFKDANGETQIARWLSNYLGKDVTLLKEKNDTGKKNPDIFMDGKYSELKKSNKKDNGKTIDTLVRSGLKQIRAHGDDKAGDVYVDITDSLVKNKEANLQAMNRMRREYVAKNSGVIIKNGNKFYKIKKK